MIKSTYVAEYLNKKSGRPHYLKFEASTQYDAIRRAKVILSVLDYLDKGFGFKLYKESVIDAVMGALMDVKQEE